MTRIPSLRWPRSRRMILIGAVAVFGLSACGTAEPGSSEAPATTMLDAPVIKIAGTSGTSADVASSESYGPGDTKVMAAYISYTYTGAVTDLTSPAASWFFAPDNEPTPEQITAVAAAFGVAGDAVELPLDRGGGWMVGPEDYSLASVTVGTDSMLNWWYSPGMTDVPVTEACAYYPPGDPAGDPDTAGMPVCEEPQPPANVPTAAQAEDKARELFAALGLDMAMYEFETYADDWGAGVTGYLLLDGVRTNLSVSVGYGAEGALTWAGGFLATPQRGADYPRVGIDAAVERLNDQSNSWMTIGSPMVRTVEPTEELLEPSAAVDVAVVPPSMTPAPDTPIESPAMPPTDSMLIDPAPVQVEPVQVEPVVVTLTSVSPSLEQVWAADETVWLLPGYAFEATDGGRYTVNAVADEYLEFTEPAPMPIEPMLPVDGTPVDGGGAGDAPPTTVIVEDAANLLIGLSVEEAAKLAESLGWQVRVARLDGEDLALTEDYNTARVNVAVEAGFVTEVVSIG